MHVCNYGDPEVSLRHFDIEISGLHPVELPVKNFSQKIFILPKVPP